MVVKLLVLLGVSVMACPAMADIVVTTAELDELQAILETYETYTQTLNESLTKANASLAEAKKLLAESRKQTNVLELSFQSYVTETRAETRRVNRNRWIERGIFVVAAVLIVFLT